MVDEEFHYCSYSLHTIVVLFGYIYRCKVIILKSFVVMEATKEEHLRRDTRNNC